VAGSFTSIGFKSRAGLAAVDATSGTVLAWNPGTDGPVYAMQPSTGSLLYVGGHFGVIGGRTQPNIAALDENTGVADGSISSAVGSDVVALALQGTTLYVGGYFSGLNTFMGQTRYRIAAVDLTTGLPTPWNPIAAGSNPPVLALAATPSRVYAGGSFTIMGGVQRSGLAALDLTTGQATAWNPSPNAPVFTMLLNGSTLYVGGWFTAMGAQGRGFIAALDASTGNVTSWNPGANDRVYALALDGLTMYVGGNFTGLGGQGRNGLGAVPLSSNLATAWNPSPNGTPNIYALATSGSTVYVGGFFSSIGGQLRSYIAAVDSVTGLSTAWDPDASGPVLALLIDGSTMYVGGQFSSFIGGQARARLAALDVPTGNATTWVPATPNGTVGWLSLSNGVLYFAGSLVGGGFSAVGGVPRNGVAAADATTGALLSWNPAITGGVNAVVPASGSHVFLLGSFSATGDLFNTNLAEVDAVTVGVPEPPVVRPASLSLSSRPNPLRGAGRIRFFLPRTGVVMLSLYDVSGREVARLADGRLFEAGWQEIPLKAGSLRGGIYLCSLRSGGELVSRRMVVIP
jgi:hypothetical protein